MPQPLLTIHVSVFNLEKDIKACLDSILSQSFTDYELLLIDNGSTDNSLAICREYERQYPDKIRFYALPLPTAIGRAYVYARNFMQGQYFMAVDGDDEILPGCLEKIAQKLRLKQPDVLIGTYECQTDEPRLYQIDKKFEESQIDGQPYDSVMDLLLHANAFHHMRWKFITKNSILKLTEEQRDELLLNMDLYNTHDDEIDVIQILHYAKSFAYIKEPFYIYKRRVESATGNIPWSEHGINYLITLILLQIRRKSMNITRENPAFDSYLTHWIDRLTKLITLSVDAKAESILKLAGLIEKYSGAFYSLREYHHKMLDICCDLVEKYGALTGLSMYQSSQAMTAVQQLLAHRDKDIYLAPMGIRTASMRYVLERWGFKVAGFLDNAPEKEGNEKGLPCILPCRLQRLPAEQLHKTAVAIAPSNVFLEEILSEQFISEIGLENVVVIS